MLHEQAELGELLRRDEQAIELGVSRATLYRWVGDRDRFASHVLWSLAEEAFAYVAETESAADPGPERVAAVVVGFIEFLAEHPAFVAIVGRDAEYALRLFTGPGSMIRKNVTDAVATLLREQGDALVPPLAYDTLAYVVVRVIESFLYSDVITGEHLDLDNARIAVQLLLQSPGSRPPGTTQS